MRIGYSRLKTEEARAEKSLWVTNINELVKRLTSHRYPIEMRDVESTYRSESPRKEHQGYPSDDAHICTVTLRQFRHLH
jgi:hypothetical protein